MDKEGEIRSDVFLNQLEQVHSFVKYLTYHRYFLRTGLTENSEVLTNASNAFLRLASIAWCDVFGSSKSDLHWSKTIRNMPKDIEQDFKNRIYESTNLDEETYQDYQRSIKTFRDKYIAHLDLEWNVHIKNVPNFDTALKVAKEYDLWVKELLHKEPSFYAGPSLKRVIESASKEVKSLAALLSVPQKP